MSGAVTHELKCWPEYFSEIVAGRKRFEYRHDDRGYGVGDVLWLREWSPTSGHTGREYWCVVSYMLAGPVSPCVIMSIDPLPIPRTCLNCNHATPHTEPAGSLGRTVCGWRRSMVGSRWAFVCDCAVPDFGDTAEVTNG